MAKFKNISEREGREGWEGWELWEFWEKCCRSATRTRGTEATSHRRFGFAYRLCEVTGRFVAPRQDGKRGRQAEACTPDHLDGQNERPDVGKDWWAKRPGPRKVGSGRD